MFKKSIIVASLLLTPIWLMAAEVVGKIQSISQSAKVIQYVNPKTKEVTVIKFTDSTELRDAQSFKELTVNTKFKATVDENNIASKIKPILVKVPAELVIDTDTLSELLEQGKPLFIDLNKRKKLKLTATYASAPMRKNLATEFAGNWS